MMEKRHQLILRRNRVALVDNIDIGGLWTPLLQSGLVNVRQKQKIQHGRIEVEQVEELLDLLPRLGEEAFDKFCHCLEQNGQGRIVEKYLSGENGTKDGSDRAVQETQQGKSSFLPSGGENKAAGDFDEIDDFDVTDELIHNLEVKTCDEQFFASKQGPDYFPMSRNPRGLALIINIVTVKDQDPRGGTNIDRDNLRKLWEKLHFRVIVYNDEDGLTAQGIKDKVWKFSQSEEHAGAQCMILCLLSHGDNGVIFGTDGGKVELTTLQSYFSNQNCKHLVEKPKLIFTQACRGDELDGGVRVRVAEEDASDTGRTSVQQRPALSDFLVAFPTLAGFRAWRTPSKGSWFIQAVVQVFARYACKMDICAMLHKVNGAVQKKVSRTNRYETNSKSQMSEYKSNLTKSYLFFFPGITHPGH